MSKPAPTYTCDHCGANEKGRPALTLTVYPMEGGTLEKDLCGGCLLLLVKWIDNG
jgi:hypothetical protein